MTQESSGVYRSRRPDGRFTSTEGSVHHYIKRSKPKPAFDPNMKTQDFPLWRGITCGRA